VKPVDRNAFGQYDATMPNDDAQPVTLQRQFPQDPMTPAFQRHTDRLVKKTWLWAFPQSVRPNHLTVARFILIPVVLVLLYYHYRWWALGVFAIAICTDFVDGAMARTRDQITASGTLMDPVADKLLVGSVLAWVGYHYLVVQIILAFIALELLLMAAGTVVTLRRNQVRSSNAFGKIKMVVQSVALFLFLLFGIVGLDSGVTVTVYMLWVALGLGVLSGGRQVCDMMRSRWLQA
jgi:CDP-diacylglycerol--glycerol-3-phosphate 3-phosphatidyltransferase